MTTTIHRFDKLQRMLTDASCRASLFRSDKTFHDAMECEWENIISDIEVLSLDIFDTLLLRDTSSELTRFYEIGAHMAKIVREHTGRAVTAEDALVARNLGTLATYRASPSIDSCREGSLTEIHQTSSFILTGSKKLAQDFIETELLYESSRLEPNNFLLQLANNFRAQGGIIILVTDMYMHATQVVDLLSLLGVEADTYDEIFSSADTKVSKASGGIFSVVEKKLVKTGTAFLHLGDSLRGDYMNPRRHGWRALHLPLSENDIRKRVSDHNKTANLLQRDFGLTVSVAPPS